VLSLREAGGRGDSLPAELSGRELLQKDVGVGLTELKSCVLTR
jgi:hypothetical protein